MQYQDLESENRSFRSAFFIIPISCLIAMLLVVAAGAATTCTTRKSGSVTITSCSSPHSQCRSYYSGRVLKTTCRR
jgi:hypothetical protein